MFADWLSEAFDNKYVEIVDYIFPTLYYNFINKNIIFNKHNINISCYTIKDINKNRNLIKRLCKFSSKILNK